MVLISTADDLPIGAAVCGANRQDQAFTGQALASIVVELPADPEPGPPPQEVSEQGRRADGKRSGAQLRQLSRLLWQGRDVRALPYTRGDGNFAKLPARLQAKHQGFRLWAPGIGQSRRGLGPIRSCVERAHAFVNQFGRVARRLDRSDRRYLAWVEFACSLIFMRRGFFP